MAKPSLCQLIAALLCAIALINGIQAEIPAAEAKVEARNDEAAVDLAQADAKPLPMKAMLADIPAKDSVIDEKMDEKPAMSMGKEPVARPMAAAEVDEKMDEQEGTKTAPKRMPAIEAESPDSDSKKETVEFVMNREVLKEPGMARLARRLRSFHNYQVRRTQSRAANRIQDEYDNDDEDDGIVPEERAIRRRKRVRRRKVNNRLRRTNRRKNVSQRRHNQGQSVRRPSMKKSSYPRRSSNNRRDGNKKSSKPKSSNKKRRSGQKKRSSKTKKQNSSKAKRSKKGRRSNRRKSDNSASQQASQLIVFMDSGVPVAEAA